MRSEKKMRKELSNQDRSKIIRLRDIALSFHDISSTLEVPLTTVKDAFYHFLEYDSTIDKRRSGRPPIFSERDLRELLRLIEANRRISIRDIQKGWPTKVSARTIQRMVHSLGLRSCVARKKPFLSENHKKARLQWARERRDCGIQKWNKVIWTDESSVEIGKFSRQVRIWRTPEKNGI